MRRTSAGEAGSLVSKTWCPYVSWILHDHAHPSQRGRTSLSSSPEGASRPSPGNPPLYAASAAVISVATS